MSGDTIRYITTVLILIFLFDGEPDVWDKLHDKVMSMENCK